LARTADAIDLADGIGDAMLRFLAYHNRHLVAFVAGDFEEMDRCIAIMGSLTEQLGQPMLRWTHTYARATQAVIAGDTDRAEELVMEALQLGTDSGQPDAMQTFGLQLMATRLQKGTLGELTALIEQMGAVITEAPDAIKSGLLLAHADGGRIDEARDLLEECATRTGFDLVLDASWNITMCAFAEAAILVNDPNFAGPLFDHLAPWAAQWCTTGITGQGPVSHYVGGLAAVLGRFEEADAYFAQSAAMCDRAGARFFAARTQLLWGQMLTRRAAPGDAVKAHDLLTAAHTVAVEQGYGTVARRAAAALQSLTN
jgi:hypothetical protein